MHHTSTVMYYEKEGFDDVNYLRDRGNGCKIMVACWWSSCKTIFLWKKIGTPTPSCILWKGNKMTPQRTEDLVFVHSNLHLLSRNSSKIQWRGNKIVGYCKRWLLVGRQWDSWDCSFISWWIKLRRFLYRPIDFLDYEVWLVLLTRLTIIWIYSCVCVFLCPISFNLHVSSCLCLSASVPLRHL